MIVIFGQNKVTAINFKLHYDLFMDIKKSNFLEDRFELSSFSLKIYNAVCRLPLRFCEFCQHGRENSLNSQPEARLY